MSKKKEETIDDEPTVEELFGDGSEDVAEEKLPKGCVRNSDGKIIKLRDAGLQPVVSQD